MRDAFHIPLAVENDRRSHWFAYLAVAHAFAAPRHYGP
jgi:hypothetical protein